MGAPEEAPLGGLRAKFGADLPLRAVAGVTLMAVALGVAWAGGFSFLAFWLVASAIVVWEWQRLVGGERSWARIAAGVAALVAAAPTSAPDQVLPGETLGQSFGPPIRRPPK